MSRMNCANWGDTGQECVSWKENNPERAQDVANAAGGLNDTALFGQGDLLVTGLGLDDRVDSNSSAYANGEAAGVLFHYVFSGAATAGLRFTSASGMRNTIDAARGEQSVSDAAWNTSVDAFTFWAPAAVSAPLIAANQIVVSRIAEAAFAAVVAWTYSGDGDSPYKGYE